jgi:23S rRNA pseudouridine1911/1915/1917 synthase
VSESVVVPAALTGARLDRFVATLGAVGSRTAAERLISRGGVRVEGEPRDKAFRVLAGMRIEVDVPQPSGVPLEADASIPYRIVYADEAMLVVDKPAGVIVHPAPGVTGGTLVHGLVAEGAAGGSAARPGVVHRLDKDTSGLLVVARSEAAYAALGRALRRRAIRREYVALVHGRPASRSGRIEAPVGRDRGRGRMRVGGAAPRDAVTHFALRELLPTTSLLDVRLETGRTHQIRVHLEAIGMPVVGDPVYAPRDAPRFGLGRQFLHATRLTFPHPLSGEELVVESPLPADLEAALARARDG